MKLNLMTSMNKKGTLTFDRLTVDLDKMQLTADRMAKIIKGLKTLSRNSTADPYEKISIQKIVSESLEFCMDRLKERGIELKLINNLDVQVSCREVQLSQVVINLVNNSSDAILDLESKWIEIEVVKNEEKNTISVIITDSGNGIPLEIANKLMTPFFSTKGVGKGTGLGLSISRKILKEHGGEIRLDQSYHHTRFIIELPV
jgi:C4-dicarboxylate-specific signal transduction histidine kinase